MNEGKSNFWSWYALILLVGIMMAAYYLVDAVWIHPENYSSRTNSEDIMWESRDDGNFYAP